MANNLLHQLHKIKAAQPGLAVLSLKKRNQILNDLSELLLKHQSEIIPANQKDIKALKRVEMLDRLVLNPNRIGSMIAGLRDLAKQPEVLNKVLETRRPKNGLVIKKVSVPLGVVGVIYESRPNVTIDLAGLGIKSGNAVVLKGGSEAYESNKALVGLIHQVLKKHQLAPELVYLINPKDAWQKVLLNAHGLVDVLIPRGSNNLITWVRENSKLPVIETGAGVCHTLVDDKINAQKAADIIVNAKTQRPDVCNALDTLVIHQAALKSVLPLTAKGLAKHHVEIFADADSHQVLKKIYPAGLLKKVKPSHYGYEFLAQKMAIKTVKNFEEGLLFVKKYTSGHSESLLSHNTQHIARFLKEIDAAAVYANVSTRFTDGGEFGMGAEVGISTQKLHARGPMGLESLTSYKWVVSGNWAVRK